MMSSIRRSRKGQSTTEWVLILALIALATHAATSRTGTQIENLFNANAQALGVQFPSKAQSEVSFSADEGGIAATGQVAHAPVALVSGR